MMVRANHYHTVVAIVMDGIMEVPRENSGRSGNGQSGRGDQNSSEAFHFYCSFHLVRHAAANTVAASKKDLRKVTRT
jgi:hypothetical protein